MQTEVGLDPDKPGNLKDNLRRFWTSSRMKALMLEAGLIYGDLRPASITEKDPGGRVFSLFDSTTLSITNGG